MSEANLFYSFYDSKGVERSLGIKITQKELENNDTKLVKYLMSSLKASVIEFGVLENDE